MNLIFPVLLVFVWGADRQFCNTNNIVQISQTSPNITETCGASCPVSTGIEFYWKCGMELDYDWRAIPLMCFSGCFYPRGADLNTFSSAFASCLEKYESSGAIPIGKSMGYWLCSSSCYLNAATFGGDCNTCIGNKPEYDEISGNKCWFCQNSEW